MTESLSLLLVPLLSAIGVLAPALFYQCFEVQENVRIHSCTVVGVAFTRGSTPEGQYELAFDVAAFLEVACLLRSG